MRRMKTCARLGLWLLALLGVYTLLLFAAYSFPDAYIERNVSAAVGMVEEETNGHAYANYFWHTGFSIADTPTDRTIFMGLLRNGRGVTQAAMRTDYARYWHGYAVLLRPMMAALSIVNLRYLNMMAVALLALLCACQCRDRLGTPMALCFVVGLCMSFVWLAPFCQQYMAVTLLTLLGCYAALRLRRLDEPRLAALFLTLGSLVCFFDFLTFPVLALGYPLVCCLARELREGESAARLWKHALLFSVAWMAGYALTWLGKGVIGGLLTGQNVIGDIFEQVAMRTTGAFVKEGRTIATGPWVAISICLETFFMGANKAMFALLLCLCAGRALRQRASWREWARALPIAAITLWPFFWYAVVQNHTRVHFWMTYKQLSVTVFAPCAALLALGQRPLPQRKA